MYVQNNELMFVIRESNCAVMRSAAWNECRKHYWTSHATVGPVCLLYQ